MTMKSVYIVYITNCFLWTMSDNKTYLILSTAAVPTLCCAWWDHRAFGRLSNSGGLMSVIKFNNVKCQKQGYWNPR